ncbi:hypothetical protein Tco_0976009 [Tanacetum coccineum]|uniref:Uncharacterized protein n=1 Tax=Tanacetum coccineum TaxID=301880 RepID=A0ABQ5EGF3_9ASTR
MDDILASKFMEIFRNLYFELSFADALIHMPQSFVRCSRKMFNNIDKLIELTKTPLFLNENPCDLGASINLMPLSIWKKLQLSGLGTENTEKDEKQSQNDKTRLGMEKTVKDKANQIAGNLTGFNPQPSFTLQTPSPLWTITLPPLLSTKTLNPIWQSHQFRAKGTAKIDKIEGSRLLWAVLLSQQTHKQPIKEEEDRRNK